MMKKKREENITHHHHHPSTKHHHPYSTERMNLHHHHDPTHTIIKNLHNHQDHILMKLTIHLLHHQPQFKKLRSHTSHHQGVDPSLDYPPPPTQVTLVSHEQTEARHSFRPHMPSFNHQHTHQPGAASGLDLYNKPSFKVYSKAQPEFHLTIRGGKVILAPLNPSDEFQVWKTHSSFQLYMISNSIWLLYVF